jgi:hypothetical protein
MPAMHTSQAHDEALEAFAKKCITNEKYSLIIELEEQLKKAHFVIAQLQHENREMKKKSLEHESKKDILVTCETSVPITPTCYKKKVKGR